MPGSGWPSSGNSGRRLVGAAGTTTSVAYATVSVTPGNSSAFGSWVQVDASVPAAAYILSAAVKMTQSSGTWDAWLCQLQVGTGAAASESAIATAATSLPFTGLTAGGTWAVNFDFPAPPLVSAASRLAVRGARDGSTSTMTWTVMLTYVVAANLET